jgi:hypothetical protein
MSNAAGLSNANSTVPPSTDICQELMDAKKRMNGFDSPEEGIANGMGVSFQDV